MNPSRKDRVEVRHELDIVAIVPADLLEAVGEMLAAREMLLEAGKTAAERVAAGIDDLRVRQRQVDQAYVRPVVRHLVDEVRSAALALNARLLQVLLAERAKILGGEA